MDQTGWNPWSHEPNTNEKVTYILQVRDPSNLRMGHRNDFFWELLFAESKWWHPVLPQSGNIFRSYRISRKFPVIPPFTPVKNEQFDTRANDLIPSKSPTVKPVFSAVQWVSSLTYTVQDLSVYHITTPPPPHRGNFPLCPYMDRTLYNDRYI